MTTRNEALDALFALGAAATWGPGYSFLQASRRAKHFADVPAGDQPAFFQVDPTETPIHNGSGMPAIETLDVWWVVYFSEGQDPSATPSYQANDIVEALTAALVPPPYYPDLRQTLGGLVHNVIITGATQKVPGDDDGQGLITINLKLTIP